VTEIRVRLTIDDPVPGVRYSLQKDDMPFEPVTAGEGPISFDVPISLHDDGRMTGPFVRREGKARRFVYIRIGISAGDHATTLNRRAKIDVHDITPALLDQARGGAVLEVGLPGRGKDGTPACATVRPIRAWRPVG
jgi:hypothetical protein